MLPVAENDRMIGAISDRDIAVRAVADDVSLGDFAVQREDREPAGDALSGISRP